MRGYCGIAFYQPKYAENLGGALRSAHCFGADFIALIGARYRRHASDTTHATRHVPVFNYPALHDFLATVPEDVALVALEVDGERRLPQFTHPHRAIYMFGGEDRSLPDFPGFPRISIDTHLCLNLGTSVGICLYDRFSKAMRGEK